MEENTQSEQPVEQVQEPIILDFKMSLANVTRLLNFLGQQPHDVVSNWIGIIRSQAMQQVQALSSQQNEETPTE